MNRGLAVIACDAVGAAAGGLVRDGETGLVVPAGDPAALAGGDRAPGGLGRAARAAGRRRRTGRGGYTHEAWAEGFSSALASVGVAASLSFAACGTRRCTATPGRW